MNALENNVFEENSGVGSDSMTYTDSNIIGSSLDGIDVLIAGDIFYDDTLANDLFPWFQYLTDELGKIIIFKLGVLLTLKKEKR